MKQIQKTITEVTMEIQNAPIQTRIINNKLNDVNDPAAWFRPDPDVWMPNMNRNDPDVWGPPPIEQK